MNQVQWVRLKEASPSINSLLERGDIGFIASEDVPGFAYAVEFGNGVVEYLDEHEIEFIDDGEG